MSQCSKNGKKYENDIYNIVKNCVLNGISFNTQFKHELGGCNHHNDIECNFLDIKDIPIEIKKKNTPDWMQCSLHYNKDLLKWSGTIKNKIPNKSKLFNGKYHHLC
jgi:hypothetical protein